MGLLLALVMVFAQSAIAAPGPAPSADVPPITLDVVVRDTRNRPVEGLTVADFAVSEQGTPMQVTGLTRVRTPKHTLAVFLDEFHVTPGPEAEQARRALIDVISSDLGPDDAVVVLKPLESVLSVQVAAGGRDAALEALRSFSPRQFDYEPRTDFERRFIAGAGPPQ